MTPRRSELLLMAQTSRSPLRLLGEMAAPGGNDDYRAGYKAGWSHAHRSPGRPSAPSGKSQEYVRGYNDGHKTSGHAQSVLRSVLKLHQAVHVGDRDSGLRHADEAQDKAHRHILKPHFEAMSRATDARSRAGLSDDSKFHSAVKNWSGHVGERLQHGVRRPVMSGHIAAITQLANSGDFHPADFHERLVHAVGVHARKQGL